MSCLISKKIPKSCEFSVGGVSLLYLANWSQVTAWNDTNTDDVLDEVTFNTTAITNVTNANPAVVTAAGHGLNSGDIIEIVGTSPMDGLVGQHTVGSVISSDDFELSGYDSTALAVYGATSASVQEGAFYEIEFLKEQASFSANLVVSNGNRYVQHVVNFQTTNTSQGAKEQMDQLALGRLVAVFKDNMGNYLIFGKNNGLEATVIDLASGAAGGDARGYSVTLQADEFEYPAEWDETVNGLPLSAASV